MLGKVRRYENMEDALTRGIDVSLRYAHKGFSAGLGYSYLDTDAHVYDDSHDRLVNVTIDGMAHHKGNMFVTWTKTLPEREGSRMFQPVSRGVGLYGRFSTKRYYQVDGDGKGYQIWRLAAHYNFNLSTPFLHRERLGVGLDFGIDNIFNYCDRTPHGLHLGTTTPGRTVYATLTVQFRKGKNAKFNNKSNIKNIENNEED
jgi:outer membrane receptor for ferrienterochelin and colicins